MPERVALTTEISSCSVFSFFDDFCRILGSCGGVTTQPEFPISNPSVRKTIRQPRVPVNLRSLVRILSCRPREGAVAQPGGEAQNRNSDLVLSEQHPHCRWRSASLHCLWLYELLW